MNYFNSVFSKVISPPFILTIVLLAVVIFVSTIFIQKMVKKNYINQLRLSKLAYEELYDQLFSDAYNKLLELSKHNPEIKEAMVKHEIEKEFSAISDVLLGCKAMIALFDEISLDDYELKEIANVISYINDVIDSEHRRVDKLNKLIYRLLAGEQLPSVDEVHSTTKPKVEAVEEETMMEKAVVTETLKPTVTIAKKIDESTLRVDNSQIQLEKITQSIKDKAEKIGVHNIGYKPVMMSAIEIPNKDMSNREVYTMDNKDMILENNDEVEVSVFGKGMHIDGNVNVDSPLIVRGEVKGNITCKQEMEMSHDAIVTGDVIAKTVNLKSGKVIGEVNVTNTMYTGTDTYVKGDVSADTLIINGAVEGNITARSEVSFSSGAKVLGDIRAVYIDIEKGAKISGTMNIGEGVADTTKKPE